MAGNVGKRLGRIASPGGIAYTYIHVGFGDRSSRKSSAQFGAGLKQVIEQAGDFLHQARRARKFQHEATRGRSSPFPLQISGMDYS
jgi:hypothetical protein